MAVHHLTVTLTGAAQALSTPAAGSPSINCREVQIQSELNNATVAVGGSTVTITDYGRLLISSATVADVVVLRDAGNNINLASTYVFGTLNQKIHVLYVQ